MSKTSKPQDLIREIIAVDPELGSKLKRLQDSGLHEEADFFARRQAQDSMIPNMGNKLAYQALSTAHANDGIHVHVDLNDFGQINKYHGDAKGDEAIIRFGFLAQKISMAFDGKSMRSGGDEFKFWFPNTEAAFSFARELRTVLEKEGKIAGTHNLSASLGIGYNTVQAEKALLTAKAQLGPMGPDGKRTNIHPVGNAPTVVNSELNEGPPLGWKEGDGSEARSPVPLIQNGLTLNNPLRDRL